MNQKSGGATATEDLNMYTGNYYRQNQATESRGRIEFALRQSTYPLSALLGRTPISTVHPLIVEITILNRARSTVWFDAKLRSTKI